MDLPGAAGAAPVPAAAAPAPVLVVGVGNLLMGDEGVGIHVVRTLEAGPPLAGARLLDGGTGGINLLEPIVAATRIIMVDATRDGRPSGTIGLVQPRQVADLPRGLSAHDFGVKDLFAAAALLGRFPALHLFTISVETVRPMCLDLSPEVAASVPPVVALIESLAPRLAADPAAAAQNPTK